VNWLADPASVHGLAMRTDWYVFIAAGAAVGVFVYACVAWCLIAYRAKPGRDAIQFSQNSPLELVYVVIPILMVIALFIFTYRIEVPVDGVAATSNRIAVTAFRWSWEFVYPGQAVTSIGTPAQPPTLYMPLDRLTEIDLRSDDVTHSFWVPAFLFKRDAIPGMTNVFDITPNRLGTFEGRCAQFCGLDHAVMTFVIKVVPAAAYDRYLASRGNVLP
jgi:cytochrome c oxidase subunit II